MVLRAPLRVLVLVGILIAGVPGLAAADWLLTPFLGVTFHGDTTLFDPENAVKNAHWTLGGAVALTGAGPFGAEAIVVYAPGFFQDKNPSPLEVPSGPTIVNSRMVAVMGNGVLTIPRSWNEYGLRPFVSGGLGLIYASSTDARSLLPVRTKLVGYNAGGGAVGFFTPRVGLRFELRYFGTVSRGGDSGVNSFGAPRLSFWSTDIGVVLRY